MLRPYALYMNWIEPLIIFLTFSVMILGVIGTVLPALPGIELIWLTALAYGLVSWWMFRATTWWSVAWIVGITFLLIIGEVLSYGVEIFSARKTGASWQAILASVILGLIGTFIFPILGTLIGAILGVFLVEWVRRKNWQEAIKAATGTLMGFGISVGVQFVFGLMMIAVWGVWVFVR